VASFLQLSDFFSLCTSFLHIADRKQGKKDSEENIQTLNHKAIKLISPETRKGVSKLNVSNEERVAYA